MCLLVLAFDVHPDYALIVAGNRDEFHRRPTQDARWWADEPDIAGGRDLLAGGTWLAVHRGGRFATVTNYRGVIPRQGELKSRGHLVSGFLKSDLAPVEYLRSVRGEDYAGFNLLVADGKNLAYLSNQGDAARELSAGIYGLANAGLDSPGERIGRSKARLDRLLSRNEAEDEALMVLLGDREPASANPADAPFVVSPEFGTRCSTVVTMGRRGGWRLFERRFDSRGNPTGESLITENG